MVTDELKRSVIIHQNWVEFREQFNARVDTCRSRVGTCFTRDFIATEPIEEDKSAEEIQKYR